MLKQFSAEFKMEAVKRVETTGGPVSDDERIRKLERENRELREENEILKKAAAYFAKNLK